MEIENSSLNCKQPQAQNVENLSNYNMGGTSKINAQTDINMGAQMNAETAMISFLESHEISKTNENITTHQWFRKNKSCLALNIKPEEYDKFSKLMCDYLNYLGPMCFDDPNYSELCLNERLDGTDRFALFLDIDFPLDTFINKEVARDLTLPSLGISSEGIGESEKERGRYNVHKLWTNLTNIVQAVIKLISKYYGEELASDHVVANQWPFRIHMYFPKIVVNEDMARRFRQIFCENPQVNDHWKEYFHVDSSVYDSAVYAGGLRMIGCHKTGMIKPSDRDAVLKKTQKFENMFNVARARNAYCPVDLQTGQPLPWTPELIRRCMFRRPRNADLTRLMDGDAAEMDDDTYRIMMAISANPALDETTHVGKRVNIPATIAWVEEKYNCRVANGIRILANDLSNPKLVVPINSFECKFQNKTHAENRQFIWITDKDATQRCFKASCKGLKHHRIPLSKYTLRVKEELREFGVLPRKNNNLNQEISPEKRVMSNRVALLKDRVMSHKPSFVAAAGKNAPVGLEWFEPAFEEIVFMYNGLGCTLPLMHSYCPLCDIEHDLLCNYIQLDKNGVMTLKCIFASRNGAYLPNVPIELDMFSTRFILDLSMQPVDQIDRRMEGDDARMLFEQGIYIENDDELNQLLYNALSGYTQAIARVFLHVGMQRYRVTGANEWFEYDIKKGLWVGQRDISIPNYLDEVVASYFREVRKFYSQQNVEIGRRDKQVAQVTKIIDKLCDHRNRPGVIKDAQNLFRMFDTQFFERLDKAPHLFAFNNGWVCDLEQHIFRPSMPEDWLSLSSDYGYIEYEDVPVEEHKLVDDFFISIMPRELERKYLLCNLASCLDGKHPDELMHFLQGNTRNGKGVIEHIIFQTLGSYAATFAAVLLQQREQDAGKPDPLIINLVKCRVWTCNEVQPLTKLNNRTIKFLTGSPYISARLLFSNIIEKVRVSPRIIMFCNEVPQIDVYDDATGRRIRIQHLEITFTENPDPRKKFGAPESEKYEGSYESKIDLGLKDRLGQCQMALFYKLFEYHKMYAKEGLQMTPLIRKHNEEYEIECDPVKMWVISRLRKTKKESDSVRLNEAFNDFSEWYKSKHRISHPLITSAQKLKVYLMGERIGVDLRINTLHGVQLIGEEDDM